MTGYEQGDVVLVRFVFTHVPLLDSSHRIPYNTYRNTYSNTK